MIQPENVRTVLVPFMVLPSKRALLHGVCKFRVNHSDKYEHVVCWCRFSQTTPSSAFLELCS